MGERGYGRCGKAMSVVNRGDIWEGMVARGRAGWM